MLYTLGLEVQVLDETWSISLLKDTGDVVEEVLVLEAALLTDLIHRLQEEMLTLRPIILQENDHMTQSQVVSAVCEGPQLRKRGDELNPNLICEL